MRIQVYAKPSCVGCTSTCREFDLRGVEYEVLDVPSNPEALKKFKLLKGNIVPLVVTPWGNWSGFQPELIDTLVALLNREKQLHQAAEDLAGATVELMVLINQKNDRSSRDVPLFTPPSGEPDELAYPAPIPD